MIETILKTIDGLNEGLTKNDVLQTFDDNKNINSQVIIPSLENCIRYTKKIKLQVSDRPMFKKLVDRSNLKGEYIYIILTQIKNFVAEINANIYPLRKISDDVLPDKILKSSASMQIGTILALQDIFCSVSAFAMSLCLNAITTEKLNKGKARTLDKGIIAFASVYRSLQGNINKDVKLIQSLSTEPLTHDSKFRLAESASKVSNKFELPINKFVGLPIFHFRKWLVDRDIAKYDLLKEKKKLLELKIISLESGETSEKTKKAISYYEDKIETIEYKMSEIEN